MSTAIEFSGVTKSFGVNAGKGSRRTILDGLSLKVEEGELVSIVGPSGIGKTTLLHLAAGLDQPDSGAIRIASTGETARVGMVFQQPRLLEWLTVEANLYLATDAAGVSREEALTALSDVHLEEYRHAFPLTLSGGQRQRVALARAIAIKPNVVMLDEPFSALDELSARKMRQLLQEIWLRRRFTGMMITHNTLEAALLSDQILVLEGRPAHIVETIRNLRPRPRSEEDPSIFELHRKISRLVLGAEASPNQDSVRSADVSLAASPRPGGC
jgi:NitT/TauT family transport system ATP-binding protein